VPKAYAFVRSPSAVPLWQDYSACTIWRRGCTPFSGGY